eukprot:572249-Heterocapsa_arctica.AAC.1
MDALPAPICPTRIFASYGPLGGWHLHPCMPAQDDDILPWMTRPHPAVFPLPPPGGDRVATGALFAA